MNGAASGDKTTRTMLLICLDYSYRVTSRPTRLAALASFVQRRYITIRPQCYHFSESRLAFHHFQTVMLSLQRISFSDIPSRSDRNVITLASLVQRCSITFRPQFYRFSESRLAFHHVQTSILSLQRVSFSGVPSRSDHNVIALASLVQRSITLRPQLYRFSESRLAFHHVQTSI